MLLLVTYDVNTETKEGKKRLNKVSKKCVAYGTRVQCSVFECHLDHGQARKLQAELEGIIDVSVDSLRFYNLGNRFDGKVIHIGAKPSLQLVETLII